MFTSCTFKKLNVNNISNRSWNKKIYQIEVANFLNKKISFTSLFPYYEDKILMQR